MSIINLTTELLLYRSFIAAIGLFVIFLGYRLFSVGVYEKASELRAAWGDKNLVLKQAAPGTVFAAFGATVMLVNIWQGVQVKSNAVLDAPLANTLKKVAEGAELSLQERSMISEFVDKSSSGGPTVNFGTTLTADAPSLKTHNGERTASAHIDFGVPVSPPQGQRERNFANPEVANSQGFFDRFDDDTPPPKDTWGRETNSTHNTPNGTNRVGPQYESRATFVFLRGLCKLIVCW